MLPITRDSKKTRLFIAAGLLLLLAAMPVLSAVTGDSGSDKSFIWEVRSPKGMCYVLGSIHMLKKEFYPLPAAMEKAFEKAEAIVVEADISDEAAIGQVAMLTLQKGMYQGEDTLKSKISEETYQLVETFMKENDMDIDGFKKFKPWLLAMTLTSMSMLKKGFDPNLGIDKYFLDRAKDKKEIKELEGMAFQVDLLSSFSEEEGENFLFYTLQETSADTEELDDMISSWRTGDAEKMAKVVTRTSDKYPELKGIYQKLIEGRNQGMAEKVESYLNTGKIHLVISGAAHLVGDKGIIKLLEDKGYKVKQL